MLPGLLFRQKKQLDRHQEGSGVSQKTLRALHSEQNSSSEQSSASQGQSNLPSFLDIALTRKIRIVATIAKVHTPPGTAVRLELAADDRAAHLVVTDNGTGVSTAERGQLLRRFFRAEASRTTPGNGLGLSLVAAAASAHRGVIVIGDENPGLRVAIRLPLSIR